jgi:hypothetical protein
MSDNTEKKRYYRVQYMDTYEITTIALEKVAKVGNTYFNKDFSRSFVVMKQLRLKYNLTDVENIIKMMDGYNVGSVQYKLLRRMMVAYNKQIPDIDFTEDEQDILQFIYYNKLYSNRSEEDTLKKILKLKKLLN